MAINACADCGSSLDDIPTCDQCPKCGGKRRDATVQPPAAKAVAAAIAPVISVGYTEQASWQQKWLDVERQIRSVEDYYAGRLPDVDNMAARMMVENLLKTCREFAESIEHNTEIESSAISEFMHADPSLTICDGLAQTNKHTVRTYQKKHDPITAWVASFSTKTGMLIKWRYQSQTEEHVIDALELSQRCVIAWREFLEANDLLELSISPIATG